MAEPRVKGIVFKTSMVTLGELYGPEALEQIKARLPPELAEKLKINVIFTGNWYPLAWYRSLYEASQQVTGVGVELPRLLTLENLKKDLSFVYRMFVRLMSPETVISRAAKLFGSYHDTGTMEILEHRPGWARGRCTGCVGFDRNVWAGILGGCEAALVASGVKQVRMQVTAGGGDGDEEMAFEAFWE
jgi:hypothetical protein